jgi:hypothetical protein
VAPPSRAGAAGYPPAKGALKSRPIFARTRCKSRPTVAGVISSYGWGRRTAPSRGAGSRAAYADSCWARRLVSADDRARPGCRVSQTERRIGAPTRPWQCRGSVVGYARLPGTKRSVGATGPRRLIWNRIQSLYGPRAERHARAAQLAGPSCPDGLFSALFYGRHDYPDLEWLPRGIEFGPVNWEQ